MRGKMQDQIARDIAAGEPRKTLEEMIGRAFAEFSMMGEIPAALIREWHARYLSHEELELCREADRFHGMTGILRPPPCFRKRWEAEGE